MAVLLGEYQVIDQLLERALSRGGELVNDTGRFLSHADIHSRQAGLHPTADTVTYYCQGGVRAAHTALAFRLAGFERVRVYDGSWAPWGNDPSLPVAVPADAS
ncbi:MAG: hypothetical protein JOY78_05735 [Pseudonocardia sp.]|nr:hypothetical protein [Pseudonocardia sp.]